MQALLIARLLLRPLAQALVQLFFETTARRFPDLALLVELGAVLKRKSKRLELHRESPHVSAFPRISDERAQHSLVTVFLLQKEVHCDLFLVGKTREQLAG